MTIEEIRDALALKPFQPFKIRMVDGRAFEIRHPEFIIAPDRARKFVFYDYDGGAFRVFDTHHALEIEYPMDVEPPEEAVAEVA